MSTTISDLKSWLLTGKLKGATHMIVVCETFDWEDYPVYIMSNQNIKDEIDRQSKILMQRVMEVYNLNVDINAQINKHKAFEL